MSSQTFPQNVEPEKSGEMTQMPKKIGNSFQTFRNSANILTPLSSESSMHVDPCLSLLCFHGFFRDQVRFCSQLCHNPLNLHTAWEFLYVVTNKQAFSNRPTFTLCCLKGNSACQCGMAVENTRSSHQHAPKSAKRPLLEWTGRFVLLLVQYAGSLVICKGWRRPNTMDIEKSGDLSGCHCAKSCRTMRFCSFMSHQQGTWTKQVQICTYARMHEVPSPTGQFLDLISYRKYIYIYIQMHIQIYVAMIMYIRLNLYVSKKKNHFPMYIAPGCLSTLWTISSMGIPGSLAQLNNWARMPFLMSYGSTCCQSNFTTAFFSCQCSLISSSSSLSIVASLDLEGFDVESTCSLQFSYKILRMQ